MTVNYDENQEELLATIGEAPLSAIELYYKNSSLLNELDKLKELI